MLAHVMASASISNLLAATMAARIQRSNDHEEPSLAAVSPPSLSFNVAIRAAYYGR